MAIIGPQKFPQDPNEVGNAMAGLGGQLGNMAKMLGPEQQLKRAIFQALIQGKPVPPALIDFATGKTNLSQVAAYGGQDPFTSQGTGEGPGAAMGGLIGPQMPPQGAPQGGPVGPGGAPSPDLEGMLGPQGAPQGAAPSAIDPMLMAGLTEEQKARMSGITPRRQDEIAIGEETLRDQVDQLNSVHTSINSIIAAEGVQGVNLPFYDSRKMKFQIPMGNAAKKNRYLRRMSQKIKDQTQSARQYENALKIQFANPEDYKKMVPSGSFNYANDFLNTTEELQQSLNSRP